MQVNHLSCLFSTRQALKVGSPYRCATLYLIIMFNSVLPHIVNAMVLTSAFSSANGMLYSASRLLFALGVQGQAPKVVTKVTRNGVPYVAILAGVRSTIYLPIGTSNSS
jgi:amino acid permease